MHVSLPAVPEQIQVARRIVRKELAGLGWPPAKIAACEEVAAQLARHAIGVVGVSGYYLGVTKRTGPEDSVAIRVSVTILDAPTVTVPAQIRSDELIEGPAGGPSAVGPEQPDEGGPTLAEVLTQRCGAQVNIVAQQGSWAASATLPGEVPCLGGRP
ncbi:hypothetical protein GCM10011583_10110 [Streptomyces camponoticapitis]|uniref:Uncharacterized protein n=1 Tax=Streptomyces camponoticapitis TaxID=1616125 RepID=A0ABQ2E1R3_9ACTN|nr:hypothetical protein [Streptomyces camponoticapitis]GGJ80581.1 hypothetical protein GCM10011583_10110 [Streptomyces camponoticapitis]